MDAFDRIELGSQEVKPYFPRNNGKGDAFDQLPDAEESFGKSAIRTAAQIPIGISEVLPYGLFTNFSNLLALGDVTDPEEIERIRAISEREGIPFDEEKYLQAGQQALSSFPTPGNIARMTEEATGIPLEAKSKAQKALRFASSAGKLTPGAATQKLAGATAATATKVGLEQAGVPEPFADLAGLGLGGLVGAKTPAYNVQLGKTKPSGIPARGFEKLKSTKEVSENKFNQINQKLESDFRKVSDKIIAESPIGETAKNLVENPAFKQESRELLNEAQTIADTVSQKLSTEILKKEIDNIAKKKVKGFALSEYDKSYLKFMEQSSKDILSEKATLGEIVQQYRKNNSSLAEYFEPGASKALNRAKRDALLDNNRAIANVLETVNPELSTIFKEGNARWTKIMDAEAVDAFIGKIFQEKIDYRKMHDFFDREGYGRIFQRALGDKGYMEFKQLMKDMIVSEGPYKMLKIAKNKGFEDLFKTGMGYIIHPKLGIAKASIDLTKNLYKSLVNAMLDKPQIGLHFKKAIEELKAGHFTQAEKEFEILRGEVLPAERESITFKEKEPVEAKAEPIKPEAPKQLSTEKGMEQKNSRDFREFTKEELKNELNKTVDFEKKIITRALGKELYEKYKRSGPEGRFKFWEEHRNKLTKEEVDILEKGVAFDELDLSRRISELDEIKTSYYVGNSRAESIRNVIGDIRSALINPKRTGNNVIIKNAADFLLEKRHSKEEIAQEIIKVMKDALSSSEAEFVLKDIFGTAENISSIGKMGSAISDNFYRDTFEAIKKGKKTLSGGKDEFMEAAKSNYDKGLIKSEKDLREFRRIWDEKFNSKTTKKQINPSEKQTQQTQKENIIRNEHGKSERDLVREIIHLQNERDSIKGTSRKAHTQKQQVLNKLKETKNELEKLKLHMKKDEKNIKPVQKPEISSKSLKSQKQFILDKIDEALAHPKKSEKIQIDVPGDGEFSIYNIEESLKKFRDTVEKKWPVKQFR